MSQAIVAYVRVSTRRQGISGLGLEAQQQAVSQYAQQSNARVCAAYTEVETGRSSDRPELMKALAHARRSKATLVVAKLDRLARSVSFTSALMDSGVDFIAVDNPHATRLTIHILAAIAEHEATMISERTKAALAAAKRRGVLLGAANPKCRTLSDDAIRRGYIAAGEVARRLADQAYADLLPTITQLRATGNSLSAIAAQLNAYGHTTRQGKPWRASQVRRVLERTAAQVTT